MSDNHHAAINRMAKAIGISRYLRKAYQAGNFGDVTEQEFIDAVAQQDDDWWATAAKQARENYPSEKSRAMVLELLEADLTDPFVGLQDVEGGPGQRRAPSGSVASPSSTPPSLPRGETDEAHSRPPVAGSPQAPPRQGSLLDPSPGWAHRDAGEAEREAAVSVAGFKGRQQQRILDFLTECGPRGATRSEIEKACGLSTQSATGRSAELEKKRHLIVRTERKRFAPETGARQSIWVLSEHAQAVAS